MTNISKVEAKEYYILYHEIFRKVGTIQELQFIKLVSIASEIFLVILIKSFWFVLNNRIPFLRFMQELSIDIDFSFVAVHDSYSVRKSPAIQIGI